MFQGLATGVFIYVTFFEILRGEFGHGKAGIDKMFFMLFGFVVLALLALVPDDKGAAWQHHHEHEHDPGALVDVGLGAGADFVQDDADNGVTIIGSLWAIYVLTVFYQVAIHIILSMWGHVSDSFNFLVSLLHHIIIRSYWLLREMYLLFSRVQINEKMLTTIKVVHSSATT